MRASLKTLMENLPEGTDGAIVTSDLNRRYLTGMSSSAGTLLFTKTAARFLIDFRYIEKAKSVITDFDVLLQGDDLNGQIADFFREQEAKTIAVEADCITLAEYRRCCEKLPELHLSDSSDLSKQISALRAVKSPEEIALIERAQSITDRAFSEILPLLRPGVAEREIAVELEYRMRKLGADGLAFDSIVASGVNSSMPHAVPSDKKIASGDFVTMDFGASFEGYCSDMTRTVAVGNVSAEQKKVYAVVLEAQRRAIAAVPTVRLCCEVDAAARDYIYAQGYEGCFGHGLGHSLGLFIHEEPRFSPKCKEPLKENLIITVEPGVYLEGKFGVRIEDMLLLTENGCRDLTNSPRELIQL